jgi:hypothetical protein
MMNGSLKTTLVVIPGAVIAAILIAISAGPINNPEATAQTTNATTAANQTGPAIGNLTRSDFSDALDSLAEARNAIIDNDTFAAFIAVNDADSNLYWAVRTTPLEQQISAVRDQLNNAQDAVLNQDLRGALQGVNSASIELTKLTQQLPQD